MDIKEKAKKIKLIAMDVDGVLTDGKIILGEKGEEYKNFFAQDGMGINLALEAGLDIAWISGRESKVVEARACQLKVKEVYQGIEDKSRSLTQVVKKHNLSLNQVAYIGDDLNDIPALQRVGLAIAVANAVEEVKKKADFTTKRKGGEGAVREAITLILKAKEGVW
ncbi:MAG: 3-deoxy-D-manno-octulosonate 8-phosphate phosphatase [Armatimonadetes bacterium CG07_land_8_20_14_0_80_40_9]|nr:MAG: 3-deoxy-D-manno-octulosonate 8-phosphate phosphatase [Armatimonadetes bacterium CG07_land_8_20_14_0_80_40_9]